MRQDLPRRRGPGRKNKGGVRPTRRQRGRVEEASSTSTLTGPSFPPFQNPPPPLYQPPNPLPGPPIPQYNFDLGQIPPTLRITGPSSSSGTGEQHGFHSYPEHYPPSLPPPQPQRFMSGREYLQASASGYSSQAGDVVYHGEPSVESQRLRYSTEEDNEGPSRPRLKRRRASSPPEDSAPSSSKRKSHNYDFEKDGNIR